MQIGLSVSPTNHTTQFGQFTPTSVAGCTLWLPSETGWMATDGATWTNRGSGGGSFTGTSTYVASGINGRPTLRFNGTSHKLAGSLNPNTLLTSANAYVFMAFKINAITLNNATVYGNDSLFSDSGANYGAALRGTANVLRSYNYDGTYDEPTALPIVVGGTYVLTWKHTGGQLSHQINNGTPETTASGNTSSLASAMQLCSCQGIRYASVDLMEVVGFNAAISAADEARVRTWLMARAGV